MDNPTFLLLGLLKGQSQHGYQLNEFIERNLSRFITIKKATAYSVLDRLSKKGLILEESEQVGNRPPRKVYSITPAGEIEFDKLLQENLKNTAKPEFYSDLGLIFINNINSDLALILLRERLASVEVACKGLAKVPKHEGVISHGLQGVDLAVSRQTALMNADRLWLIEAINSLESSKK